MDPVDNHFWAVTKSPEAGKPGGPSRREFLGSRSFSFDIKLRRSIGDKMGSRMEKIGFA